MAQSLHAKGRVYVHDCMHDRLPKFKMVVESPERAGELPYRPRPDLLKRMKHEAFHWVKRGRPDVLRAFIIRGVGVDTADEMGRTLLMYAAEHNRPKTALMLITNGANVNAVDDRGMDALMVAAENGCLGVVELLLKWSADPWRMDNDGRNALSLALGNGSVSVALVLLESMEQLGRPRDAGLDSRGLVQAAIQGHIKIMQRMMALGADVCVRDQNGTTLLMVASATGNRELMDSLIAALPQEHSLDQQNISGRTALMYAALSDNADTAQVLLERGANPHLEDNAGCTARKLAQIKGHARVAALLPAESRAGAEERWSGWGEERRARLARAGQITQAKRDERLRAAVAGNLLPLVIELLDGGADPYAKSKSGMDSFQIAETRGNQEILDILRQHVEMGNKGNAV